MFRLHSLVKETWLREADVDGFRGFMVGKRELNKIRRPLTIWQKGKALVMKIGIHPCCPRDQHKVALRIVVTERVRVETAHL